MSVDITIEQQIAAVRRELSMRRHLYPGWINGGRLTQEKSDMEIAAMEAVLATLLELKAERDAETSPGLFDGPE
ncbi:MAG: hypothetical protein ABI054_09615 [Planctomycetota bacterium]